MDNKKRAEFIIKGHVQGVGYRYFVQKNAQELGIYGYAKNLYNGDVEVVVEGDEEHLNTLHDYLRAGPSRSKVVKVQVNYNNYTGDFNKFSIK